MHFTFYCLECAFQTYTKKYELLHKVYIMPFKNLSKELLQNHSISLHIQIFTHTSNSKNHTLTQQFGFSRSVTQFLFASELPVQFLCLLLFGFKGTLGAEQVIHCTYDLLHLSGQIRVTLLQLVLLVPQLRRCIHQLGGLVAAVAPQLLHI